MIGHLPLIQMRMSGFTPTDIWVGEDTVCCDWNNPGEKYDEVWNPDFPTVCILPDEPLELLDLRFAVGTRVHVTSNLENRAKALLEAFNGIANEVVATHAVEKTGEKFPDVKWFEVELVGLWRQS